MTLDHGYLKTTLPDAFEIIDPIDGMGSDTGPVTVANFTPDGGGNWSVMAADITFPTFSGTVLGFPISVDVDPPVAGVSGNYNAATGVMTVASGNWKANIIFDGNPCLIDPLPLSFSTATNSIFVGDVFDAASDPPTNGAISATWSALPAGVGSGCGIIGAVGNGPGGLWLSHGIPAPTFVPPAADPPATPPAVPKKKKCKKKKKKGKKGTSAAAKCKKKKK